MKSALQCLTADSRLRFGRKRPPGELSGDFIGDENLIDECRCSRAELFNVGGKRGHAVLPLLDFCVTPGVGVRAQRILNVCSICTARRSYFHRLEAHGTRSALREGT